MLGLWLLCGLVCIGLYVLVVVGLGSCGGAALWLGLTAWDLCGCYCGWIVGFAWCAWRLVFCVWLWLLNWCFCVWARGHFVWSRVCCFASSIGLCCAFDWIVFRGLLVWFCLGCWSSSL